MNSSSLPASVHELYTFLLVFARVAGLITAAPLLSNRAIPHTVKAGFALVLSLGVTPLVALHTGPVPDQLWLLAGGLLKDGLFGLALGYLARVLFASVEMAGYFVDTQMGFGFVNLINPFSEQQASILSTFQYQLAITIYLLANGHLLLLKSLLDSFTALPPGAINPHAVFGLTIVPLLKTMFVLGLQMAMPAVGVLAVVDMAFGLIARSAPQINIFIVGAPAKVIFGVTTVALLTPVLALIVGHIMLGTTAGLDALVAGAK